MQLEFDAETTKLLETAYLGADITRRRRASFDALRPLPGQKILDIGCGNGMLTAELARAVGKEGHVIGIDPSKDMLEAARARCAGLPQVDLRRGTLDDVLNENIDADGAVSLQVFEYIDDLDAAVLAAKQTLRSGGRLVLGDMHFDTLAWDSDDPARMNRLLTAYDHHLSHRDAPAKLPRILRNAGFVVEEVRAEPFMDVELYPDGLAAMMLRLVPTFAVQNGLISSNEAEEWTEEQKNRAREGRFFFSITHFVVVARKP